MTFVSFVFQKGNLIIVMDTLDRHTIRLDLLTLI